MEGEPAPPPPAGLRGLLKRLRGWLCDPAADFPFRPLPVTDERGVERPWRSRWDHLAKRTAGPGFGAADYDLARERAETVARLTVGDEVWDRVRRIGYVDLPSRRIEGLTYRLRVGRRIEVRCAAGVASPWPEPFLCINPTYPLPEAEFFAHLYLYVRDNEDEVIRVAAPQPWDQALGRTF